MSDDAFDAARAAAQHVRHDSIPAEAINPDPLASLGELQARTRIDVHVYHHFDEAVTVLVGKAYPQATRATLEVGEQAMSTGTINVDTTTGKATLQFEDDHGDTDAAPPDGVVATFTSDNPAVLTVAVDGSNPLQGDLTPVAEGVANVGVTLADANGQPLMEADGVTPWAAVQPVAVTVNPGAAVGAQLSVQ